MLTEVDPLLKNVPPHSADAERAVLGALMIDPSAIDDVAVLVQPEHFYKPSHTLIYSTILDLWRADKPVDVVLLNEELATRNVLEQVGGTAALAELTEAVPTSANAPYYAKIVRDHAARRDLIRVTAEVQKDAFDTSAPTEELLDRTEKRLFEVTQQRIRSEAVPVATVVEEAFRRLKQLKDGQGVSGLPTGFVDVDELTQGFQPGEMTILAARPSMGKCVAWDTEVLLSDGSVVTIEEVHRARRGEALLTLDEALKLRLTTPSVYVDDGVKPVFRVTTRLGRTIETTASHPFLTVEGWRPLAELSVGVRIAVPRVLPVFGAERLRPCEVKLLAYLIGDGGLTGRCPHFTNTRQEVAAEFLEAVAAFGGLVVRRTSLADGRAPSWRISADRRVRGAARRAFAARLEEALVARGRGARRAVARTLGVSPATITHWCRGSTAPDQAALERLAEALGTTWQALSPGGADALRRDAGSPLTRWLAALGLMGKGAAEKFVPGVVFRLERPQVALFLNRLFTTDGWVTVLRTGQVQVGYASVSERLARQVQHLLLRFGVVAKVRRREVLYRGERRPSWQLDVTDAASLRAFVAEIGVFGKAHAVERARQALAAGPGRSDTVPVEVWARLEQARGGEAWASLGRRAGLAGASNLHVGARAPSRDLEALEARPERAWRGARSDANWSFASDEQRSRRRFRRNLLRNTAGSEAACRSSRPSPGGPRGTALAEPGLVDLARSDVLWDEVVSIEAAGSKQVYDLTIPETHNFVAGDVCVHNTSFCLNILRNITVYQGRPAVFFSLEMPRLQVTSNILCSLAKIDGHRLRGGYLTRDEERSFLDAAEILAPAPLFIDDTPGLSTMELRAKVRRLKAQHDIGFVVIDYLQLMSGSDRSAQESRQQEVSEISRMIKALARELHIPIMALAQLSRKVEERKDHKPMMSDLRESGCLAGDTLVTLADTGRRVPIRDLEGRAGFEVWALNQTTYRLERASVSAAFCTGVKPVFRLVTRQGRSIRATANHRFLTVSGWRRLDELAPGERIATPRELVHGPGAATMSSAELGLLAHLIGDGCTLERRAVQYTTTDDDLAELVMDLAREQFGAEVRPRKRVERRWIQVYLPTTRAVTHGVRNPVCEWLDAHGLFGKRSHEKFVPERVFEQPGEGIARFLRHLWATDGCLFAGGSYPAIYYASSSERLAADVQALLLRLGIQSVLRRVPQRGGRDQLHVSITGQPDMLRFLDVVGAVGGRKLEALARIRRELAGRGANTNRDVIPAEVWRSLVKPAMRRRSLSERQFQAALRQSYCGASLYRQDLGRERAARVAQVLELEPLAALATSQVYWDEVVSIEPAGEERVYDLTVPGLHCFVASDVVVHNSIEQDADLIMLLFRPEYYDPGNEELKNKAEVIVAKNRNGPVGEVKMAFFNSHMRFESLTRM
ncbi:MAG: replicative DNA helicase [Planctomycetes bacterium]|nr:replicative DNA helicase [Planctomycetota bacterium]